MLPEAAFRQLANQAADGLRNDIYNRLQSLRTLPRDSPAARMANNRAQRLAQMTADREKREQEDVIRRA